MAEESATALHEELLNAMDQLLHGLVHLTAEHQDQAGVASLEAKSQPAEALEDARVSSEAMRPLEVDSCGFLVTLEERRR